MHTMSTHTSATLNLFSLMKDVSEALNFDRLDRNEDAYRKYLQCVLRVSSALLKQLNANEGHMFVTDEHKKMVKLGQQCMDRVAKLICEKLEKVPKSSAPSPGSLSLSTDLSSTRVLPRSTPTTPTAKETTLVSMQISSPEYRSFVSSLSIASGSLSEHTSLSSNEAVDAFPSSKMTGSRKLGPMEIAARQNQQLLCAFKKRQAQAKNRSTSTNLGLTLQRKMAENLAIAKAQEQVLAKKMKERQQRLEEQAVRRFHTPVGLSEDEQHQRQVYKKVLEFEHENSWLLELRKKFENSPMDITVISELIVAVLRCDSHPLTKELLIHQCKLYDQITCLVKSKIHLIEKFKVPLSRQVLKDANLPSYKTSFHHSKSGLKLSQSDMTLSDIAVDDAIDSDEVQDHSSVDLCSKKSSDRELGDDKEMNKSSSDIETTNIADVAESVQKDIRIALSKGDSLRQKLEEENQNVKALSRQATEDYERYNQENLDDLFDECSDEENEEDYTCDKTDDDVASGDMLSDDVNVGNDNKEDENTDKDESEIKKDESSWVSECGNIDDETGVDKEVENSKSDGEAVLRKNPSFENLECNIVKLKNEAYLRHLKGITDDILMSIEKVQVLFVIVYEQLDSAEGRDQCNELLEEYFFRPIWNNLLALFRLANEPKEVSLAYIMTLTQDCSPDKFGVREKLCLHVDGGLGDYPYRPAVMELLAVCQCQTMLGKLECLVKSSKQVMHCIEYYFKENNQEVPGIGADDLIPILCYIISKSCLPQLVSECHAMDKFIHEGYIMGEEGYCLTSFQTAINYMVSEGIALQTT